MTRKTECKIVQDLLPSYIDNLTDVETNSFIEKHIENCSECEELLKNMQGDIQLEKINNSKKINALKKVRNRYRKIVFIFILFVILIAVLGFYMWQNYAIIKEDNGNISIQRITFDKIKISNYTNVIIKYKLEQEEGTLDGYAYTILLLTFNEKNICVNAREQIYGFTDNELNRLYEELKSTENITQVLTNVKKINDTIIYNNNAKNGKDKNQIIESLTNSTYVVELLEY